MTGTGYHDVCSTYSIRISIVYALNIKFTGPLTLAQWHDDNVNHAPHIIS